MIAIYFHLNCNEVIEFIKYLLSYRIYLGICFDINYLSFTITVISNYLSCLLMVGFKSVFNNIRFIVGSLSKLSGAFITDTLVFRLKRINMIYFAAGRTSSSAGQPLCHYGIIYYQVDDSVKSVIFEFLNNRFL